MPLYTLTHADGTKDETVEMTENAAMSTNRQMAELNNPWRYEETKPESAYTPLQLTTQALKDILNAAANGEPYSREELESRFQNDYNVGAEALAAAGLTEIA